MGACFVIPIIIVSVTGLITLAIIWKVTSRHDETPTGNSRPSGLGSLMGGSKDEFATIFESVSDGIVTVDSKGVITMINTAAGLLTGWDPKDALGIDYRSVLKFCDTKGEAYTDDINPFTQVLLLNKPMRDNTAEIITQGSEKHISVSLSVSPITDTKGLLNGAVAIVRDVSEERKAEKQRGEFISTASHEMRTPIAAIEGYLALAMNDKVSTIDPKARSFLTKAHASTQHLGSLFQDLLTSAKAEDGRMANHPELLEMSDFLTKLSEDLRFSAEAKHLAVEFVVGSNGADMHATSETSGSGRVVQPLYNVLADPERIREVITNLFDNAVKYTDSGKISIGLTGDDAVVQIFVKDTGAGIAAEDLPHLFQKFYRVDNSSTRTVGGTGLGLFICRKIVEMYNGKLWVESETGKGSTFFINLPRLSRQKVAELSGNSSVKVISNIIQPGGTTTAV